MTASTSGAAALARALADQALISSNGVRKTFLDADHGGSANAKSEAIRWRVRIYQSRAAFRRMMYRAAHPNDIISGAVSAEAHDPDVVRTPYDNLVCDVDRNSADTGWWLTVRKVNPADLGDIEVL